MSKIEKGTEMHCLVTTRPNGTEHKVYYLYETALSWDCYDNKGNMKANVKRSFEPYDGFSFVITDNGD